MQSSSKEIIADSVTTEVAKKVIEAYKEVEVKKKLK